MRNINLILNYFPYNNVNINIGNNINECKPQASLYAMRTGIICLLALSVQQFWPFFLRGL